MILPLSLFVSLSALHCRVDRLEIQSSKVGSFDCAIPLALFLALILKFALYYDVPPFACVLHLVTSAIV